MQRKILTHKIVGKVIIFSVNNVEKYWKEVVIRKRRVVLRCATPTYLSLSATTHKNEENRLSFTSSFATVAFNEPKKITNQKRQKIKITVWFWNCVFQVKIKTKNPKLRKKIFSAKKNKQKQNTGKYKPEGRRCPPQINHQLSWYSSACKVHLLSSPSSTSRYYSPCVSSVPRMSCLKQVISSSRNHCVKNQKSFFICRTKTYNKCFKKKVLNKPLFLYIAPRPALPEVPSTITAKSTLMCAKENLNAATSR